ncbi:hypothetical protein KAW18_12360 [candidate division WOR-3 bacterium]|nr:hypothetical protein [candidate division WOR-3 bacterium]MCK4528156.1 hypothetical protein [candidate division WOR-3 bacterium]
MVQKIKVMIIPVGLLFLVSLSIHSQNKDKIDIKVLEGEKVVVGKWGSGLGEFGLKWEDDWLPIGPYCDPAIDKEGNIYILDQVNVKVHKFSKEGKFLLSFPFSISKFPIGGFLVDREGNIYIGDQVYSTEGKLKKRIPKFTDEKNTFLLTAINAEGHLIVENVDRCIQYIISNNGKIIKKGESNRIFTPVNGKNYQVEYDKKSGDLLVTIAEEDKQERQIRVLTEISIVGKLSPNLFNIRKTKGGYLTVNARKREKPFGYLVLYIDEKTKEITKVYFLPSENQETVEINDPVWGMDGNLYLTAFIAGDCNECGFWVKRYIIPEEDKPK